MVERVNQGLWVTPAPYDRGNGVHAILHTTRLGRTVVFSRGLPLAKIHRLLKPRQRQILLLLAHGLSNMED